jgi:hypothetical protein
MQINVSQMGAFLTALGVQELDLYQKKETQSF